MARMTLLSTLGLVLFAGPLAAQTGAIPSAAEEVRVRVDVTAVADELAAELGIAEETLPRSVEVPVDTAAVACDIPAVQLEHLSAVEQHLECDATTVAPGLAISAREQMAK